MLRRALVVLVLAALGAAAPASAEIVTARDAEDRAITFDVQAPGVDVDWYAGLLSDALHGDEISRVTVRVVAWADVQWQCGAAAAACYSARGGRATIVVAAGKSLTVASTLLHEYGHHVDANRGVAGQREPNGTASWWTARGMTELARSGAVARDYRLGWDRSIGEIFAEDYVQVHMDAPYAIRWLERPSQAVKDAIVKDLGGGAPTGVETGLPNAEPEPLVVVRNGVLRPRQSRSLPFGLLGPGRRVTFTATVSHPRQVGVRARLEIVCNGALTARVPIRRGRAGAQIDRPRLGPADCIAVIRSESSSALRYVVRLRLAVEAPST